MFRRVLVPLDGSRVAESALPWAAGLARRSHGRLALAMMPELAAALGSRPDSPDDQEAAGGGDAAGYIARTAVYWQPCAGAPVESGPTAPTAVTDLGRMAEDLAADLVVMAREPVGESDAAPHSDRRFLSIEVPTLLVRPAADGSLPASVDIRRILVVLDREAGAESVLRPAGALASVCQAHLTLLQAVGESSPAAAPGLLRDAQRNLDRLADRLRAEGHRVAARATSAEAGSAILSAVAGNGFDVVVLRGGGRGATPHLSALADRVVRSTARPILLVV